MKKIKNCTFIQDDFLKTRCQKEIISIFNRKIDAVFSDMAANTTGNKNLDSLRTGELCLESMRFSFQILDGLR